MSKYTDLSKRLDALERHVAELFKKPERPLDTSPTILNRPPLRHGQLWKCRNGKQVVIVWRESYSSSCVKKEAFMGARSDGLAITYGLCRSCAIGNSSDRDYGYAGSDGIEWELMTLIDELPVEEEG